MAQKITKLVLTKFIHEQVKKQLNILLEEQESAQYSINSKFEIGKTYKTKHTAPITIQNVSNGVVEFTVHFINAEQKLKYSLEAFINLLNTGERAGDSEDNIGLQEKRSKPYVVSSIIKAFFQDVDDQYNLREYNGFKIMDKNNFKKEFEIILNKYLVK